MTQTPTHPDSFCPAPFMAAMLEPHDRLQPCCVYRPSVTENKKTHEYDQWWNQELNALRADQLTGRQNPGCSLCYSNEQKGQASHRQSMLANWPEYADITEPLASPAFVMAGIGTHCNLTCIFCSPHCSSAWAQQYDQHGSEFKQHRIVFDNYPRGNWDQAEESEEILKRMLSRTREIHFVGGEPLLTPVHRRVLAAVEHPETVTLTINTSLETLHPDWLPIFTQFKTNIYASVESADHLNDYIRAGSNWDSVLDNIRKIQALPSVNLYVTHVLSRTSFWCLPGVVDFCKQNDIANFHWHKLHGPDCLHTSSAPLEQRQALLDIDFGDLHCWPSAESLRDAVQSEPYRPDLDLDFWSYIDLQDQLQHKNFRNLLEHHAKT